jgi:menaquinol-cytochrome c reductase iron-sulfur subunit
MASTPRRVVLKVVLTGGAAALCAAAVGPAAAFVVPSTEGGGPRWVRTVRLDGLSEGVPHKVTLIADERDAWKHVPNAELGAVWLVRRGDAVSALSVVCPHLGCSIDRSSDGTGFVCPCHDSFFEDDGKRRDGPSPRDMDALETRVVDGFVDVSFHHSSVG